MERNLSLDYFKIVLSILVVTIHFPLINFDGSAPTLSKMGSFISLGIAKIAVPCFFVINGYFMNISNRKVFKKYIKRIVILYITWTLFYLPYSINIIQNIQSFVIVILLGYSHLWYLSSLCFGAILLYFANKCIKNTKILLVIALILYIIGLFLEANTSESTFSLYKYRNFLFTGFPFIAVGYILGNVNVTVSKAKISYTVILGIILLVTEVYMSTVFENYQLIICLIIICPALIFYIIKYGIRVNKSKTEISYLSAGIYFIHPFVIKTCTNFEVSNIYMFPFVAILSILFSFVVIQANKTVKIFL